MSDELIDELIGKQVPETGSDGTDVDEGAPEMSYAN